jgi:uncharacterized protein YjbI with pentapeptide repeats
MLSIALCVEVAQAAPASVVNGCTIRPATLCVGVDLRAARLAGANLQRADFSQADLSAADLSGANLLNARLVAVKLNRTNLTRANLEGADLARAEMYGANLRAARLNGANLHVADMSGALLDEAQLRGANLSTANLPGAGLRNANLERADLTGAVLSHADLHGADLSGANLSNAVLDGADLTGARLVAAVLDGASTAHCIGCPAASARGAVAHTGLHVADAVVPAATAGDSGCWARIYKGENFGGEVLALIGPSEVADVPPRWGFAWDPQFNSLVVGPEAVFTVFDKRNFRDRAATFDRGEKIPDLDKQMGVFRTIRSMRLSCTK